MPMIFAAKVVKSNTDDGLAPLEGVKVGQVILVDLETEHDELMFNHIRQVEHEKRVIQCADTGAWIPRECIQLFV